MMVARTLALGIAAVVALHGASTFAATKPIEAETRLSRRGPQTCLLVSGRRSDAHEPVRIAGREIAVEGARSWRIAMPLETVRAWSTPFARSILVQVGDAEMKARLPTGLLGHVSDIAFLEVRASH